MKPFGQNMRHIRETLGLSQDDLAKRTGIKPSAISRIETENGEPTLKTIIRICKGLGCSPNVLIDINNENSRNETL